LVVWRPNRPAARELRGRIWLGLALVVIGTFLIGDTAHRLERTWDLTGRWRPWALFGLAAANLVVSLRVESMLAPGLLAFIAVVALAVRHGFAGSTVVDFVLPAVVAFAGAVTGRVEAPEQADDPLRPRAMSNG
jgi:hypothetical protein